jgi:hypothetical protein
MVVDGTSTTGEEFPCRIHPAAELRLGFVVPANTDIAMWRSPRTCWFKPTWQGRRGCAFGFGCPPITPGFDSALFSFSSADLTLLAGDFVPGFQDYPESAGP